MTFLGYEVEAVEAPNEPRAGVHYIGYYLTGPRGAKYALMRYPKQPSVMYALDSIGQVKGLKGNYTFTDEGGVLACKYR
jgi:hypothetical protein